MTLKQLVGMMMLLLAGIVSMGCNQTSRAASEAIIDYRSGNYAAAAARMKGEIGKKDNDFVLNNCRYGSCAMAAADYPAATEAFLSAYDVMNGFGTNDGGRSAGAALVFEGIKVWKGEPFEKAMAHYYLGVLYLMKNDYGNARAAFQNSLFKVREYSKAKDLDQAQEVESPFALGYVGLGICNLRMGNGDLAQASFKRAVELTPSLATLVNDLQKPGMNTLIFVDASWGPMKSARGWYNEESVFGPAPNDPGVPPIGPVGVAVDQRVVVSPSGQYATVDTLAMAQETRWQDIDTIKKFKAVVGTGMMAAGTGMAAYGADKHDKGLMWAGIGTALAGVAVSASSQSDVRNWEMLPRTVYVVPAALPVGQHQVAVRLGAETGAVPASVVAGKDTVLYFRMR